MKLSLSLCNKQIDCRSPIELSKRSVKWDPCRPVILQVLANDSSHPRTRRLSLLSLSPLSRPFGHSCGTPRQNAKLYPLVMAEMARVLRPGSGRAVLLVAQPHLLGVPGLERDNRKDRKKARKKEKQEAGGGPVDSQKQEENEAATAPSGDLEKCGRGCGGEAISRPAGGSTSSSGFKAGGKGGPGDGTKKDDASQAISANPAPPAPDKSVDLERQQQKHEKHTAVREGLWRIRSRHTVNVGGLVSSLLILDRTDRPSPLPRVDRRKRLVGLDAYCKRRREQSNVKIQPS